MEVIECWNVQTWDGGDRHNHAFYLTSTEEKDAYLKVHVHDLAFQTTLVIFDTLAEVEENTQKKVRERALAKLTPLEIKALGLQK